MSKNNMTEEKKSKIRRAPKDNKNPYVMINKLPLDDAKLSWKAKGILTYILSKPNDWSIYVSHLSKQSNDGEKSTRTGINELIENGFIIRYPIYEGGKIIEWIYEVSEWGYSDEERIKSKKIEGEEELITYYTKKELEDIKNKKEDKKKSISEENKKLYQKMKQAKTVEDKELDLLSQKGKVDSEEAIDLLSQKVKVENIQVENVEVENVEVQKDQLLINNSTDKGLLLNTDLTNQSFNNKKETLNDGRNEEELNDYFYTIGLDNTNLEKDDIELIKEVLTYMYYSAPFKVGNSMYSFERIKSIMGQLDNVLIQEVVLRYNEQSKTTDITNHKNYIITLIANVKADYNLQLKALLNQGGF